jgi:hypothetical protein
VPSEGFLGASENFKIFIIISYLALMFAKHVVISMN